MPLSGLLKLLCQLNLKMSLIPAVETSEHNEKSPHSDATLRFNLYMNRINSLSVINLNSVQTEYNLNTFGCGDFLPFFSADPLSLCQVGWGQWTDIFRFLFGCVLRIIVLL